MSEDRRGAYYQERMQDAAFAYPEFDRLSTEAFLNLLHAYDVLHAVSSKYMASFGLSRSGVNILMLLRHGPVNGMQLHDLGSLLLVSRANISGLMDHLEEKRLVERFVDASDRRARLAKITAEGEALLNRFLPVHYAHLRRMLQAVSDQDKQSLVRLLKIMTASMHQHAGDARE